MTPLSQLYYTPVGRIQLVHYVLISKETKTSKSHAEFKEIKQLHVLPLDLEIQC